MENTKSGPSTATLVLIGVAIAVVSAVSSFVAIRYAMPRQIIVEKVEGQAEQEKPKQEEAKPTLPYAIGDFIVNLNDPSGTRYLKASITLELEQAHEEKKGGGGGHGEGAPAAAGNPYEAVYKDQIITALSRKTVAELTSLAGKERLKEELREILNQKVSAQTVVGVYFTDFVIQ